MICRTVAALLTCVLSMSACTSNRVKHIDTTVVTTQTRTATGTRTTTAPVFTPALATTVPALGDKTTAPQGERFSRCPYIKAGLNEDSTSAGDNIANIEGDRVGRSTILTGYTPVGCRFYFAYSYGNTRHEAVADILPSTFATAADAHNALVKTAQAGTNLQVTKNFVPGVDGIRFQTKFFGPNGGNDWAFAFAKGKIMVVVHTQQNDASLNALLIGKAIVSKF